MSRRAVGWILLAALTGAPGVVRAQAPAAAGPAAVTAQQPAAAALAAERQRLKVDLERVNSEIDGLKRENRGLRDDYRLRNRMADAEALARRLTELDARLRAAGVSPLAGPQRSPAPALAPLAAVPEASPTDDPAVLEAKADILADQARRLNSQADLLATRVTQLRGRQELRRRAGQLEHDPFSPLEQAKRRLATSGSPAGGVPLSGRSETPVNTATDVGGPGLAPTPGVVTPTSGPPMTVGGPASAPSRGESTNVATGGEKVQPSLMAPTPAGDGGGASVSTQFRGVLDASTLAEIRRLEVAGSPGGSLPALERAVSALRARAAQLGANSNALRSRAKTSP